MFIFITRFIDVGLNWKKLEKFNNKLTFETAKVAYLVKHST